MGCMSPRQKAAEIRPEQKWDYISLQDFKSTSCFTPLAYGYLYFSLLLSIAVYTVDTFTAVNLLIFNKWSSEITPSQLLSFTASKWIFSICIILSFINLAYEHIRAQRTMHRGSVAECYLDNLAVRLESIRWGKGQGWKRFLVFAELTKSKKGAEYVALFTYFGFQSWIRVLLCSGPRQVVNALTLVSVYNARLSTTGDDVGHTILDFFAKIRALALENYQQALILSGMLFTLVIWIFSFLSLLLAFAFFIFFLWSYIPNSDGGLSGYCSRKINKRLMKIVSVKINTAIREEERRRQKDELRAAKKNGAAPPAKLTATLPDLSGPGGDDKLQPMPTNNSTFMLNRNDTTTTLPAYTSRPGTAAGFEMSQFDQKQPPMPSRSGTMGTMASGATGTTAYSGRAPLLSYAAEPGRSASPAPSLSGPPPFRPGTAASNRSMGGGPAPPPFRQMTRTNTSVSSVESAAMPYPPAAARGASSMRDGGMVSRNGGYAAGGGSGPSPPPTYTSTAVLAMPQPVRSPIGVGNDLESGLDNGMGHYGSGRYVESPAPGMLSPTRSATNPYPPTAARGYGGPPQRNMTAPMQATSGGSGSSGSSGSNYGASYGGYGERYRAHERQASEEASYSSYFELPASSEPAAPPQRPGYSSERNNSSSSNNYNSNKISNSNSNNNYNNSNYNNYRNNNRPWNSDVESQRGPPSDAPRGGWS